MCLNQDNSSSFYLSRKEVKALREVDWDKVGWGWFTKPEKNKKS